MFPRYWTQRVRQRIRSLVILAVVVWPLSGLAWGPHPTITQAALDVLATNDPLVLHLGTQYQRLTNYCWIPDFKRLPFREPDQDFYADDYLLFPQATVHFDHICPEVKKTYRPYFLRALQALRTESPANAARWVGSLLHFVEDTGSPPHASEIRGPLHVKMENWINAAQIQIRGYRPRSLGTNDIDALEGFLHRMDGLIDFSKPRGKGLMTKVVIGNRAAVEPVVLECALETSRVTADLLHTLGYLSGLGAAQERTAVLRGVVRSTNALAMEKVPARLVFLGTNIASLTDAAGQFEFRNLSPGTNQLAVFRPGNAATNLLVVLKPGQTNALNIFLSPAPANLVRNGDFKLKWVRPDAPDCWQRTDVGWEGEVIPLVPGQSYRLNVRFKAGAKADALVRWTRPVPYDLPQNIKLPKVESRALTPGDGELVFTGSEKMSLLQIAIRSAQPPDSVCESVSLITVK